MIKVMGTLAKILTVHIDDQSSEKDDISRKMWTIVINRSKRNLNHSVSCVYYYTLVTNTVF